MNLKYFCIQNVQIETTYVIERGWGNGYLVIPERHPLFEVHYDTINQSNHMQAHGDWTFSQFYNKMKKIEDEIIFDGPSFKLNSNDWIIGFDTAHYNDNLINWSKKEVFNHIRELAEYYGKEENFI